MTVQHGPRADDFVATVAEEAQLESDTARRVIESFIEALARYVPPEAWNLLVGVMPVETAGQEGGVADAEDLSIRDFLLEVGHREDIEAERAALHARVVAETARSRMTADEVDRLREVLPEEFVALFETDHRGEITEPGGATPGARIVGEGSPETMEEWSE